MSTKTDATKAALYNYIKDWRNVDGKWVYVPLHDPIKGKMNAGFKNLIIANALREASRLLSRNNNHAAKVETLAKDYAANVTKGLLAEWQEGDPICPPNWPFNHWPPPPHGGGNPDPDPIYHATAVLAGITNELPMAVRDELVGFTLQLIGETIADKNIATVGKDIVQAGATMAVHQ
jgi:hypothetical protein